MVYSVGWAYKNKTTPRVEGFQKVNQIDCVCVRARALQRVLNSDPEKIEYSQSLLFGLGEIPSLIGWVDFICCGIFGRKFISRAIGTQIRKIKLKEAENFYARWVSLCRLSWDHLPPYAGPLKRAHIQLTNMELLFFITDSMGLYLYQHQFPQWKWTKISNHHICKCCILTFLGPYLFPP